MTKDVERYVNEYNLCQRMKNRIKILGEKLIVMKYQRNHNKHT